jgi:hypothetical protein
MLKKFFVEKPIGKTPFGRPKCRWEDNNKMDLRKNMARGCWPVACCDQHGNEYFGSIKGGEILQHLIIVLASKGL